MFRKTELLTPHFMFTCVIIKKEEKDKKKIL
jgi:hypothetical protein